MSFLYEYNENNQRYIYDAILNKNVEGPKFIWDNIDKVYKYTNSLYNKKYTKIFDPKTLMKKGDVICFGGSYRNERKMIFDGEKLEELCTFIDDYGSVPPNYEVCDNGFDIGDFENSIDHNNINWLSKKKLQEIKIFKNSNNKIIGSVEIKGKLWYIDIYVHQEYNNDQFQRLIDSHHKNIFYKNNEILFLDTSNKNDIYKQNYICKLETNKDKDHIISFKNFDVIYNNKKWYIYQVDKHYNYNNQIINFPCIVENINDKYKILHLDNKDFNLTNDPLDYIIKEITCYPITIDIIKKTNDILLKEITDFINEMINNYDNIKKKRPFSKISKDWLELWV